MRADIFPGAALTRFRYVNDKRDAFDEIAVARFGFTQFHLGLQPFIKFLFGILNGLVELADDQPLECGDQGYENTDGQVICKIGLGAEFVDDHTLSFQCCENAYFQDQQNTDNQCACFASQQPGCDQDNDQAEQGCVTDAVVDIEKIR